MSPGLLFCACPFSKSPPYVLQEVLFLSILMGSYHPLFIHSQGERHPCPCCLPCHLHPIPLAFWCRKPGYLRQIAWLLEADCNVTWRRLRHDLRQVGSWYGTDLFLSFPKYKDKGKDLYTFNDTTGKTNANQYLKHPYVIALQSASNHHVFWLILGRDLSQITRWYDLSYAQGAYMPQPYHEEHETKSEIEKEETKKAATFLPQPYIELRI